MYQARRDGRYDLSGGSDNEEVLSKLVQKILGLLSTEPPTELIQSDLETLSNIKYFKRKPADTPEVIKNR